MTKNEQKSSLFAKLLLVGLALVLASIFFTLKLNQGPSSTQRLARIERETGEVSLIHQNFSKKEKIDKISNAVNLDSVETDDTGEAYISFESSYGVRIFENTLVTFEATKNKGQILTVVYLKKGRLKVENFGREGELVIAKNGQRISANDYHESELATAPIIDETPESTAAGGAAINTAPKTESLSAEEIASTMNTYRNFFFKCYTQALQKDPTAKGEVSMSFTIENNGKISSSQTTSKDLNQEEFKKCLLDVMARVHFKPFTGPPVATLFPLKFE